MPILERVLETYPKDVRVVALNFPLNRHQFARPAAAAALAAKKQGKFWELHKLLFDNANKINDQLIVQLARDIGLDMAQFERDRKSPEITNLINRDLMQGQRHGVRGTPTVFVNGKRLKDRSLAGISRAVDRELGRGQTASSGKSPGPRGPSLRSMPPVQGSSPECGG
ncbi:MAG: DsbA family protein [bacterium]